MGYRPRSPPNENGNLTGDSTNTYTRNARNQLTAISGGTTASFSYDAFGRRSSRTLGGTATSLLYDGANPVQEQQGGSPSANQLLGLGIDQYFTRTEGGTTRTLLTDALGSTIALADSAGAIQTSYTYEPFGRTTTTGAASTNPHQYTGRENDGTGLYFYRARYYHPTFQRFISEDPIRFAAGDTNLYSYVRDNPTRWRDPAGLWGGGLCVNGSYGLALWATGSVCVAAVSGGELGVAISAGGGGVAGATGGIMVGPMFTTADKLSDLEGISGVLGGSFTPGLGVGVDVSRSVPSGASTVQPGVRLGGSVAFPFPVPGPEVHGGATNTWIPWSRTVPGLPGPPWPGAASPPGSPTAGPPGSRAAGPTGPLVGDPGSPGSPPDGRFGISPGGALGSMAGRK